LVISENSGYEKIQIYSSNPELANRKLTECLESWGNATAHLWNLVPVDFVRLCPIMKWHRMGRFDIINFSIGWFIIDFSN
jgi:hypothetical protein